jgi:predicted DsbA family dithiol-disulfide isomerase
MLTVFSDLHCPWAYMFSIRLRRARARLGRPVPVQWRAWPLELVNRRGTPWDVVSREITALAQHEPDHFATLDRSAWPSTLLPAMEAVKVAGALAGDAGADRYDEAVRRAFFLERRDVSLRPTLLDLAAETGLDRDRFLDAFDRGGHRRDVVADWEEGRRRGVQGSPHAFLPDGTGVFNPGIGKVDWAHGIPVLSQVDEGEIAKLLDRAAGADPDGENPGESPRSPRDFA